MAGSHRFCYPQAAKLIEIASLCLKRRTERMGALAYLIIFENILNTDREDGKTYCCKHKKLCPIFPPKERNRHLAKVL